MLPLLEREAKQRQGRRTDLGTSAPNGAEVVAGRSREIAGNAVGVGSTSICRAAAVKKSSPATFEKIKAGEITSSAAYDRHKEHPKVGGDANTQR